MANQPSGMGKVFPARGALRDPKTRSGARLTSDAAARAAGFESYSVYLASDSWRRGEARLSALRFAAGRCRICSEGPVPLECHHSTYERLGRERLNDLIAICRRCHSGVTAMLREREDEQPFGVLTLRIIEGGQANCADGYHPSLAGRG